MACNIEQYLEQLIALVNDGIPLGRTRCVLNREKFLELVGEMRAEMPEEIEQARRVVATKNEIIEAARNDAEWIRQDAEVRARQGRSKAKSGGRKNSGKDTPKRLRFPVDPC